MYAVEKNNRSDRAFRRLFDWANSLRGAAL
jgi:hypothetical protein